MAPRALSLALAALAFASCAEEAPDIAKGQIRADLREHTVGLTSREVRAGSVTFLVRNGGSIAHELIVIRTDLAADRLPYDAEKLAAKEDGRVGGTNELGPGARGNLRLDLAAGHYALICNLPSHYQLGMRIDLTVR